MGGVVPSSPSAQAVAPVPASAIAATHSATAEIRIVDSEVDKDMTGLLDEKAELWKALGRIPLLTTEDSRSGIRQQGVDRCPVATVNGAHPHIHASSTFGPHRTRMLCAANADGPAEPVRDREE
jgi:hypothetical protein